MIAPLAITMGDVNGVGPEILARAFARPGLASAMLPVVFGCPRAYADARKLAPGAPRGVMIDVAADAQNALAQGELPFLQGLAEAPARRPGILDPAAGRAAMEWLAAAVDSALSGAVSGVVTCPINKEGIHRAGYDFRGHTDFIARRTGSPSYWMSLLVRELLVIHLSDHVSLRAALDEVKRDRIEQAIRIADETLRRLGRTSRRIAVAGLNPHAGEAGAFGDEERTHIAPAIAACCERDIDCSGPHSPDAVFRHAIEGRYDAVIAMYHDQGHIPMKLAGLDDGVNVTLGIPIVRTSVDHGTAYDIAGTGSAREHSLVAACELAARLARAELAAR